MMLEAKDMQQRYRNVFGSAEGRIVLGDIAMEGLVFDNIDPTDTVLSARKNFALTILRLAGAFDTLYPQLGLEGEKEQHHGR